MDTCTAGCERHPILVLLLRVQHAQGHCQLPVSVRYDGEGQLAALAVLAVVRQDVLVSRETRTHAHMSSCHSPMGFPPDLGPALVVLQAVDGQGDHFDPPFAELAAQPCSSAQLCGADRGVVSGVGEQDRPPGTKRRRLRLTSCCCGADALLFTPRGGGLPGVW